MDANNTITSERGRLARIFFAAIAQAGGPPALRRHSHSVPRLPGLDIALREKHTSP